MKKGWYKPVVTEFTENIIEDYRKYLKGKCESQTTIDTEDICHFIGEIDCLREENYKLKEKLKRIDESIELINLVDFTEHNCLVMINKIEEILRGEDNESDN